MYAHRLSSRGGVLAAALGLVCATASDDVTISRIGYTYYADQYGVVCDGSTENNAALNALTAVIMSTSNKAGTIVLPAGTCRWSGQWLVGTTSTGGSDIGHISITGTGPYSTLLEWTGLGGGASGTPALYISRNKEFTLHGLSLRNATIGASSYDASGNVGIRFGGVASGGTQTFGFIASQIQVSNFDKCVHLGNNDGSAASDGTFDELQLNYCNDGLTTFGSANTLDINPGTRLIRRTRNVRTTDSSDAA